MMSCHGDDITVFTPTDRTPQNTEYNTRIITESWKHLEKTSVLKVLSIFLFRYQSLCPFRDNSLFSLLWWTGIILSPDWSAAAWGPSSSEVIGARGRGGEERRGTRRRISYMGGTTRPDMAAERQKEGDRSGKFYICATWCISRAKIQ